MSTLLGFEPTSFRFKVQIPSWIISFSCPNQDLNPHPSGSNLKVLGFEPSPLKEVTWGSRFKSRYDWKKICLQQNLNPHPWGTNLEVWGSNPLVVEKVLSKPGFEPTPFRSKVQVPVWSEKKCCPHQDSNPHLKVAFIYDLFSHSAHFCANFNFNHLKR